MDPVTTALEIGGKLIDRLWPDPQQRDAAKLELLKMQQAGDLAVITGQLEVNKAEAANTSVFVSGWRPSVGWVCSAALAFQFIVAPLIQWTCAIKGSPVTLPALDTSTLLTLLFAMLGVGGMRTVEKLNGVAK